MPPIYSPVDFPKTAMMTRAAVWIGVGLLGVAAASALMAAAPERLRPIVIMPVLFGALTAFGMRKLAHELHLRTSLLHAAFVALLVIAGLVNVARLSFNQLAAAARRNVADDPQQLLGLRLLEADRASGREARKSYQLARLRLAPQFEDYLTGRLLGFGWMPGVWPAIIWGGELLLSGGIAMAVMRGRPAAAPAPGNSQETA